MKIYPIRDANDRLFAIEVENAYIGARSLADVIGSVQGVSNVSVPDYFLDQETFERLLVSPGMTS